MGSHRLHLMDYCFMEVWTGINISAHVIWKTTADYEGSHFPHVAGNEKQIPTGHLEYMYITLMLLTQIQDQLAVSDMRAIPYVWPLTL